MVILAVFSDVGGGKVYGQNVWEGGMVGLTPAPGSTKKALLPLTPSASPSYPSPSPFLSIPLPIPPVPSLDVSLPAALIAAASSGVSPQENSEFLHCCR